jgi:hypothetical protein
LDSGESTHGKCSWRMAPTFDTTWMRVTRTRTNVVHLFYLNTTTFPCPYHLSLIDTCVATLAMNRNVLHLKKHGPN